MRTTIDLPDELYRSLKARAALSGTTMKELIQKLIESGLRQSRTGLAPTVSRREPPPVVVPRRGIPLPAITSGELRQLEEEEDQEKHGRSTGR